jgi:hypothetical protein
VGTRRSRPTWGRRYGIRRVESDVIAFAFLLVIPAFLLDRIVTRQRTHEAQLLAEQLRVLHVTMRTVQDIVNNNLNRLQLLRLEADGHVSDETLKFFDETIRDTAAQLMALGNMEVFAEKPMASGSWLDVSPKGGIVRGWRLSYPSAPPTTHSSAA